MNPSSLPPGQQLAAIDKWPVVGQKACLPWEEPWRLEVRREGVLLSSLTLAELQQLPVRTPKIDVHCVTRWSKPGMAFTGVLLADVLARCDQRDAQFVEFVAHSEGNHSTSLPLSTALDLEVLLAWAASDTPLTEEHGGPLRSIAPGRYFYKSLKWLRSINLLAEDRLGYWEGAAGYHNNADPQQEQRYIAQALSKQQAAGLIAERDVAGKELLSLEMADHNLAGLVAQHAILRNADFSRAALYRANFTSANLSNARFTGAKLCQAIFANADLEGADFSAADLRGANLQGASLFGASFVGTHNLPGAVIDKATRIDPEGIDVLTPAQAEYLRRELAAQT